MTNIRRTKRRGQSIMEYMVLVALLAVGSIPVIKILGDVFRDGILDSADALAGGGSYNRSGSQKVRGGRQHVSKGMDDFGNENGPRSGRSRAYSDDE